MQTLTKKDNHNFIRVEAKRIPVLHIIKSLGRGGAETLLPETLAKHNQEKYVFHYIYFLPWKFQMVEAIEKAGGIVHCFSAKDNFQILRKVFKIIRYIKKHNIQLIHCHLPWAGIVGRIAGRATGVPVIYTEHNKWERYHKLTFYLNRLSFSSQEKVIAVSQDVANSIKAHHNNKKPQVQVVLNGINTEKFFNSSYTPNNVRSNLHIPASAIVIGISCVFRVQKRLTTWLQVAKSLHDQFPHLHFIIAGDGVLKEEVFEKVKSLKTENYVHFVGLQADIKPYLQAMDIFMMTSEFEGLPIALLEAMSMGCMPASTAAGGIPELIKDGINGVLVPVNEPLKLVDRLSEYIMQHEKIKKLGTVARQTVVENFSMEKMVGELENIYDEILDSRL